MKSDATFSRRNRSSAGWGRYPSEETPTAQNYNLQEMERKLILDVLNKTGGNKSKAAELLGITREGLRKKLLRMGINDKELPHDDGKA